MKTKTLLFVIFTLMLFSLGILVTTLFNTTPNSADAIGMFYTSAFLFFFGVLFFGSYLGLRIVRKIEPGASLILTILRSVFVLDLFLLSMMAMRGNKVLNWPSAIVLLLAAMVAVFVLRRRVAT